MTIANVLLLGAGMVTMSVLLCKLTIWYDGWCPWKKDYDERQSIAQGKAGQTALLAGTVYYILLAWYLESGEHTDSVGLLIMIGLVLQCVVFMIYCMLTNAVFPLFQKPGITIMFCIAWTMLYGWKFWEEAEGQQILSYRACELFVVVTLFATMTLVTLIGYIREKRTCDE